MGRANPQAQYRGVIALGPERMSFTPCGDTEDWWIDDWGERADPAHEVLNSQPECDLHTIPCTIQSAYVEMDAEVIGPGSFTFGHMGKYPRKVAIKEIFFASSSVPETCP